VHIAATKLNWTELAFAVLNVFGTSSVPPDFQTGDSD